MQHKPVIYVSRITNLSDARYCAGMGVDMVGFVIDPTDVDYVSPRHYQEINGWISGPKRVIEIPPHGNIDLEEVVNEYKPDLLHVSMTAVERNDLPDLPLLLEVSFDSYQAPGSNFKASIEYVLMKNFSDSVSLGPTSIQGEHSILLSLDSHQEHVMELLNRTGARGFALQGSRELVPGLKDYDHLSRILEALEA